MKLVKVQDGVGIKEIHWDLDGETPISQFELIPVGDTHIGSPVCNFEEIKRTIKYVQDSPTRFVILHGDFIDNGIPDSKTDVLGQTMNMQDQIDLAIKLLEPIKERVLCIIDGNHESRTKRVAGIDITSFMAFRLGVDAVYSTGTGAVLLDLKFGRGTRLGKTDSSHHFTVVVAHGVKGGVSVGAAADGLESLQKIIVNADLYVVGHTHKILNFIKEVYYVNSYGFLETKIQYYVNATAYLKYGDYGKNKLYPPTTIKPQAVVVRASEVKKVISGNTNRTKQYFICDVKNI